MNEAKQQVVDAGRWLAAERGKRFLRGRSLSTIQLAKMVNAYIGAHHLPVKTIHQQEISGLENATMDKGPKKLPPWWVVIREFIASGKLDEMIAAADTPIPDGAVVLDHMQALGRKSAQTPVTNPAGEVIGHIVWDKTVRRN